MDSQEIHHAIKTFLVDECGLDGEMLADGDKLFSSRLLNSLDILNIVGFLEKKFGIQVGTWEVSLERFDTIADIAAYVEGKRG